MVPLEVARADQAGIQEPEAHRRVFVSNTNPGGYWEDQGYNWFSGL
jgi:DMSO/TMAO reductase YedYZ molybdopterin-dependent catalytic subunit